MSPKGRALHRAREAAVNGSAQKHKTLAHVSAVTDEDVVA